MDWNKIEKENPKAYEAFCRWFTAWAERNDIDLSSPGDHRYNFTELPFEMQTGVIGKFFYENGDNIFSPNSPESQIVSYGFSFSSLEHLKFCNLFLKTVLGANNKLICCF